MSEPVHQATAVSSQSTMLVIGDRRISIDEWPLAKSVEESRSVAVQRPTQDQLLIGPGKRTTLAIVVRYLAAFALGPFLLALGLAFEWPWWLSALLGLALVSLLIVGIRAELSRARQVCFDRRAGRLTVTQRTGFRRRPRVTCSHPLKAVLAVQLLYNGRHSVTEPQEYMGQQGTAYREFCGYELNLILDDPAAPRLHLFSVADWAWVRQTGQSIGEFLGVPVIDRLYHGG
jgi:hypothetical protein